MSEFATDPYNFYADGWAAHPFYGFLGLYFGYLLLMWMYYVVGCGPTGEVPEDVRRKAILRCVIAALVPLPIYGVMAWMFGWGWE